MYKLLVVFCLFIGFAFKSDAKGLLAKTIVKPIHHSLQVDSSKINIRHFNATALDQYLKDPDFNYQTDNYTSESLWSRFWGWIWHIIEKLLGNTRVSSSHPTSYLKYLLLTAAAGLIIYVIIKAVGVDNIFNRESKPIEIPYTESLENIHEITFDEEIEKAMAQRNYKLAVRLLYLRSLKQLSDAQLIHWQIEKTNATYLNELINTEQRQPFSVLTRQFEYVWYGDFPIDGQSFQNINTLFHDFKRSLL
jgi:hypothetical protein